MIYRGPLKYHNNDNDDSLCEPEILDEAEIPLYKENAEVAKPTEDIFLPLKKCILWILFLLIVVMAVSTTFYWKPYPTHNTAKANVTLPQGKRYTVRNMTNPDFVVKETTLGALGLVCTVLIAVVTSACGIFCTYFGSAVPGDIPRTPFSPRKSPRRSPVNNSSSVPIVTPAPLSPLPLEYLIVPLNIISITVAMLWWLHKELGVTIL